MATDLFSTAVAIFRAGPDQMPAALSPELAAQMQSALAYRLQSLASATLRAYVRHWREFRAYCARFGKTHLPAQPETVALYLAWLADYRHHEKQHDMRLAIDKHDESDPCPNYPVLRVSQIQQRLAAVSTVHRFNDLPSPADSGTVQKTLDGIINAHQRTRGVRQRQGLSKEDVREIIGLIGTEELIDVRDRALLLLLFLGAFRRSELAALRVEDVTIDRDGLVVRSTHSKTNQHGRQGVQRKAIAQQSDPSFDPVRWYTRWLEESGIMSGDVFRALVHGKVGPKAMSGDDINEVLKRRVLDRICAWLVRNEKLNHPLVKTPADPSSGKPLPPLWTGKPAAPRWVRSRFTSHVIDALRLEFDLPASYDPRTFSAHGARIGFVTLKRDEGRSDYSIKQVTWHKSDVMLDRYTYSPDLWRGNATKDTF
jgi:integrase